MSRILISTDKPQQYIILSGDTSAIITNRRAARLLKDTCKYSATENALTIEVEENPVKTIERVCKIISLAKCEYDLNGESSSIVSAFKEESERFAEFSSSALKIKQNQCSAKDFAAFKDSLEKNMRNRRLYPLQLLAAYHMAFSQNSCNFSVPGAGKTSVVYGAYAYLKNLPDNDSRKIDQILIIAPLNAFAPWEDEYKACFGVAAKSTRLSGSLSLEERRQYLYSLTPAEITLMSYASVVSTVNEVRHFLASSKTMVVLDEAHKIKNTDGGVVAESIMNLAELARSRIVLTGTPAPNGYEDLHNLFKFVWPSKRIIPFNVGQLRDMSRSSEDVRVPSLLASIDPYYLRIKKSDLGIPPAIEHPPVIVKMDDSQRRIYDYLERRFVPEVMSRQDRRFRDELIRARIIRLMQAATNPSLLLAPLRDFLKQGIPYDDNLGTDESLVHEVVNYSRTNNPPKFLVVEDLIRSRINNGERVIVWAIFVKTIDRFSEYLSSRGIPNRVLYGATPIAGSEIDEEDPEFSLTREAIVREFHSKNSSFNVIIANPFAVSESISLHKACHTAIYLERSFNAAHFLQSKDRIHRYGLSPDVKTEYFYLCSEASIDQVIHARLLLKEQRLLEIIESMPIPLFNNVMDDSGNEDLKAIINDYASRSAQS